jgi:hypothetical protein
MRHTVSEALGVSLTASTRASFEAKRGPDGRAEARTSIGAF